MLHIYSLTGMFFIPSQIIMLLWKGLFRSLWPYLVDFHNSLVAISSSWLSQYQIIREAKNRVWRQSLQEIDRPMQSTQPLDFTTIMSLTWKLAAPFCYATAQLTFPAYLLAELPSFLPLHCFFLYTAIRRCLCFLSRTFTDTCTQYLLFQARRESPTS